MRRAGSARALIGQASLHVTLALGAAFMLLPFWLMLRSSVTPPKLMFSGDMLAMPGFTLDNYRRVFADVPIVRYYLNGLFVVASILAMQLLVCLPAAYAMSRLRFTGKALSIWIVLAALMVPYQVTAIPVYVLLASMKLINSRAALIVPFIGSAFSVFLLRQFFLSIPSSVFDSARLDGASTLRVLTSIVLPMARPAILTFVIFSFVSHWNDYFWPSFVLRNDDAATVPFGIVKFLDQELGSEYGPQMAAATLTVLPLLIGFLLAQKQLIAGMAMSSGQVD